MVLVVVFDPINMLTLCGRITYLCSCSLVRKQSAAGSGVL